VISEWNGIMRAVSNSTARICCCKGARTHKAKQNMIIYNVLLYYKN
jgi:hypothetical protein